MTPQTYTPPLGDDWYGFAHRITQHTRSLRHCLGCGSEILPGSPAHTWVMPITVDAYPYLGGEDWRAHQATTEYRGSLTRCYECLHCYVAQRVAHSERGLTR
jgi:hypothetical protein